MASTKVYLSWSGELGRRAAEALRDTLPEIVPDARVWTTGSDLTPGMRWADEIARAIESSDLAVVCITKDSRNSSWLLYEAGMMAGRGTRLIPWLVDLEHSELDGPLAQYQTIGSDSTSFLKLVREIDHDGPLSRHWWPRAERWASDLETEINRILRREPRQTGPKSPAEWLTEIDEAALSANRDELQSLRNAAETEGVSDVTVVRAFLNAYFEERDHAGLIDTFERFAGTVRHDPEALARFAWALVRTGQSSRAITVLNEARTGGAAEAEILALLARAYKDQWRERTAQGNTAAAEESLRQAARTYVEGFEKYPQDYYLGLNAVQLLHLLGDGESLTLRDELLPRVQAAAERTAAESGYDYWSTAGLLDLAVVRGSESDARQLARQLLSKAGPPWQIETTVQNLRLLSEAKGFGEHSPSWLGELVSSLSGAVR